MIHLLRSGLALSRRNMCSADIEWIKPCSPAKRFSTVDNERHHEARHLPWSLAPVRQSRRFSMLDVLGDPVWLNASQASRS